MLERLARALIPGPALADCLPRHCAGGQTRIGARRSYENEVEVHMLLEPEGMNGSAPPAGSSAVEALAGSVTHTRLPGLNEASRDADPTDEERGWRFAMVRVDD